MNMLATIKTPRTTNTESIHGPIKYLIITRVLVILTIEIKEELTALRLAFTFNL